MKVIAHRGYSGLYPENTMLAFKKAAEAGCDGIEMDVQLSKDGQVVIIHDETVDRVTGSSGLVRELTVHELQKLNASGKFGEQFGFNTIPTLDEYCGWVKNLGIFTNIELKCNQFFYEGLAEETITVVKKHGIEDRVLFSSFNHVSLLDCKKIAPGIPCGILVAGNGIGNAGYYAASHGLEYYHPDIETLTREAVEDCRSRGIKLNVYTVNDMEGLITLKTLGCDGIITNFPDVCKKWLDSV
ncbi:glycerophosphodiester phosphodiesterase [Breznakiella homolactica]|uniref:Glycerophosphodiester phosphodiesterase n=1 Tax=Breznakiella homolactica TaxID=2798577 RepID=A0A7T7XKX1_9SPIR|nr:glycerophosphodiester phosphodiesterase [Breznakiella homolactica]QQO08309.1 glycerophosphodiester phosphodiesterase [Breznakiella homolactica]